MKKALIILSIIILIAAFLIQFYGDYKAVSLLLWAYVIMRNVSDL